MIKSKQMFDSNRQIAQAAAGGVIERIGNGWRDSDQGNFPQTLDSCAVELEVWFVDKIDLDRADVGVHRYQIVGEIGVEETAVSWIDFARFVQRCADAPHDTASDLARGSSRTYHTP